MAIRHRPSKNLQNILANLLDQAETNPGEPARQRLRDKLQVDIRVVPDNGKTHLQISRSRRYPRRIGVEFDPAPLARFSRGLTQSKEFAHGTDVGVANAAEDGVYPRMI